jgi:hypothetical protein
VAVKRVSEAFKRFPTAWFTADAHPVGYRMMSARYRYFKAACSVVRWDQTALSRL